MGFVVLCEFFTVIRSNHAAAVAKDATIGPLAATKHAALRFQCSASVYSDKNPSYLHIT